MGFVQHDTQKEQEYARNVKRASTVIYVGGVLFAEVMFLWYLSEAFESGIVAAFAGFGAILVGFSSIIFLYAKEHWLADGLHEKLGYTFWGVDIAMLALNTLVAFEAAGRIDSSTVPVLSSIMPIWRVLSPMTPVIIIAMWAILRAVSPEMELQKSHNKSMAKLIKYHAEQLEQEAMNSPEAKRIIANAAREVTLDNARLLTGKNVTSNVRVLPAPMNADGIPLSEMTTDEENGHHPK